MSELTTLLDELNRQLEEVDAKLEKLTKERERAADMLEDAEVQISKVEQSRKLVNEKINMASIIGKYYEEKEDAKRNADSEALATLFLQHRTSESGASDDDFRNFAEQTCLAIPAELIEGSEPIEQRAENEPIVRQA